MKTCSLAIAMTIAVIVPAVTFGGFGDCKSAGCGEGCSTGGCEPVLRAECKWVDVEKQCWEVECKNVAVPPVKLPKFADCLRAVFTRKAIGVLPETGSSTGCGDAGCTGECGIAGCGSSACDSESCVDGLKKGLLGRHARGQVRKVAKLKSTKSTVKKQVVEWKIVGSSEGCGKSCTSGCTTGGSAPPTGFFGPTRRLSVNNTSTVSP